VTIDTYKQPKMIIKYVSRNFQVAAVRNGTADLGSPEAYSIKLSQLLIQDTNVSHNLNVVCAH